MTQLDAYVDIKSESLTELLELAKQHAEKNITHPERIEAGRCYSNGKLGTLWNVREVLDAPGEGEGGPVVYRGIAGDAAGQAGQITLDEFRAWARFEVRQQDNGRWVKQWPAPQRVTPPVPPRGPTPRPTGSCSRRANR